MKSIKLIWVVGGFCGLLILGLIWSEIHHHGTSRKLADSNHSNIIQDKASGDTETEVLKTILANQSALKDKNKQLETKNQQLQKQGVQDLTQKFQSVQNQLQSEIETLKGQLDSQHGQHNNQDDDSESEQSENHGPHVIHNVQDLTNTEDGLSKIPSDHEFKNVPLQTQEKSPLKKDQIIPFYAIPANSTLNHVKLMTSIIGEVPVSGKLKSPAFPFKAIIGKKDLFAANGMSLPRNLRGTVVQGYSIGNMTLSCARMYVTRLLFVFDDGHFVVYPKKDDSGDATDLYPKNALGYLSDAYGNTCVAGRYISDVSKVLGNLALLGGMSEGANAIAQAQFSTLNSGDNLKTSMTGNISKLMGASMLKGGSQEILKWYQARVDDVFDAIFIPASWHHHPTNLVFNVTKTIPIDFDKKGRTIHHELQHTTDQTFSQLD